MSMLSIVIPAYNEYENVPRVYERLTGVLDRLDMDWELIFAVDPCTDGTEERILALRAEDERVKMLRFSRRFGQPAATLAGMEAADGDAGPVVCEVTGFRWMYFLLAPGEVRKHNWPLGVQRFGEKGSRTVTYIGIPALDGNTWPLRWYSEPTVTTPFVEAGRLRTVLGVAGL
jgi:glycosyltransferase involved in cell wall biosynthesis